MLGFCEDGEEESWIVRTANYLKVAGRDTILGFVSDVVLSCFGICGWGSWWWVVVALERWLWCWLG